MRRTYVFASILSIPLILAPIALLARSFIPAKVSYIRPPERQATITLAGRTWAYSVPFPVHHKADLEKLIQCESQGENVSRPDSDGVISDGILQFHEDGTWQDMERRFGFRGSPIVPEDAIRMADMMIDAGFLRRWTCARILHLVP